MVVLMSCAFAAPAGLLAWRLSGTRVRGSDLALGFTGGVFGGTLVLAVFAPLVALYYHSSAWAGPVLGIGSAGLALLTGTIMFVRGVVRRLEPGTKKRTVLFPVAVTLGMQLLTLVQLATLASPIFPERTIVQRRHRSPRAVEPRPVATPSAQERTRWTGSSFALRPCASSSWRIAGARGARGQPTPRR